MERNGNNVEEKITGKQMAYIKSLLAGVDEEYVKTLLTLAGVKRIEDLSKQAASSFIDAVKTAKRSRTPRKTVQVPHEEREAVSLAQTTDAPEVLEELYKQHKEKPRVVRAVVNNPHCPADIKRDYLDYVFGSYLRAYEARLRAYITDWDDLLDAVKICIKDQISPSLDQELYQLFAEGLNAVSRVLPAEVSADIRAEIASRFAITAFLERRRSR